MTDEELLSECREISMTTVICVRPEDFRRPSMEMMAQLDVPEAEALAWLVRQARCSWHPDTAASIAVSLFRPRRRPA